jgi:hypothetical protein
MPESGSNQHVVVTAEERAHPAITKLARACIAMARDQLQPAPAEDQSPVGSRSEARHD